MKPDSMDALPLPGMAKSMINGGIAGLQDPGAAPVFGDGTKKPKAKSQVASFLSGATLPAKDNVGTKTLTGQ